MNKTKFISGVASAANIVFTIMKVLSAIGAVCILLGIATLTFLPQGTLSLETASEMNVRVSLKSLAGETWNEVKEELMKQLEETENAELTEEGLLISESAPMETIENRSLALSLIPVFAELIIFVFFYHYLSRVAKAIKNSFSSPFPTEAAENLKNAGISLFFLAGAPAVCSWLILFCTKFRFLSSSSYGEVDLTFVLWGFVLIALSYIFEYGACLSVPMNPYNENKQ